MVSFKGSFVFCLFYLYSYGVVQRIFCFLLVLSLWLWCRSRDLLFFACFTLMVMVSFKGAFVVCLFYLDGYGVVQGIFYFLLVLPWWLWCRSRDLLFFACFTLMVMVSFKGSFVMVFQGIFYFLLVLPWWLWCRSNLLLFVCFFFIVWCRLFYFLLVLPWWLWCRSRELFVCFIFIVMVSFKGSFIFCLFYLDGYGVVQGSFCCLFVLSL